MFTRKWLEKVLRVVHNNNEIVTIGETRKVVIDEKEYTAFFVNVQFDNDTSKAVYAVPIKEGKTAYLFLREYRFRYVI